jgi:RNA polymerase sigma-70 factor (ECF subfamily)
VADDANLFRRSIAEPEAFEGIFDRYYDQVLRFARQRTGHDVGEEIAARTFEIAFARRASFNAAYASARPWLFGITANLIRHHLRDEQTHLRGLLRLPSDPETEAADDVDRLHAALLGPVVLEAIAELQPEDRETFLQMALLAATYQEIADSLGIPVGTVRSRIHRARRFLRERLSVFPAINSEMSEGFEDG